MASRRRVLHVVASTQRRGAEVFAAQLSDELCRRGWDSSALALQCGIDDELPIDALSRAGLSPRVIVALSRRLDRTVPVVGHGSSTLPACALARRGKRGPFVYKSIGDPRFWQTTALRRVRTRLLLRNADRVVALWGTAADAWHTLGVDRSRIRVIPNGVSSDAFRHAPAPERARARDRWADLTGGALAADRPVAAYVGALSAEKRPELAIRSVAPTEASLLIAGGGSQEPFLRALADDVAPGRVHFVGVVSDVATVMAAADVCLLPSRTEGMPGVVLESLLVGTPVVAFGVGAVPEIARRVGEGISLVEADDERAFSAATRDAVRTTRVLGRDVGDAVRNHYGLAVVGEAWSELLDRL